MQSCVSCSLMQVLLLRLYDHQYKKMYTWSWCFYTAASTQVLPQNSFFFSEEFLLVQIVCQRAGGAGIHCPAHTFVSGYVNSCTHSVCVSGSGVACETSKAFVLIEARVDLQNIHRFLCRKVFILNTSKPVRAGSWVEAICCIYIFQ